MRVPSLSPCFRRQATTCTACPVAITYLRLTLESNQLCFMVYYDASVLLGGQRDHSGCKLWYIHSEMSPLNLALLECRLSLSSLIASANDKPSLQHPQWPPAQECGLQIWYQSLHLQSSQIRSLKSLMLSVGSTSSAKTTTRFCSKPSKLPSLLRNPVSSEAS